MNENINKEMEPENENQTQNADHVSGNSNLDDARKLIHEMKEKFEEENQKIAEIKNKLYKEKDFKISKFTAFDGPNYYMDRKSFVFNIFIAPSGDTVDFFRQEVAKVLPMFAENKRKYVIDLLADVLLHILKMDIDLYKIGRASCRERV